MGAQRYRRSIQHHAAPLFVFREMEQGIRTRARGKGAAQGSMATEVVSSKGKQTSTPTAARSSRSATSKPSVGESGEEAAPAQHLTPVSPPPLPTDRDPTQCTVSPQRTSSWAGSMATPGGWLSPVGGPVDTAAHWERQVDGALVCYPQHPSSMQYRSSIPQIPPTRSICSGSPSSTQPPQ